MVLGCLLPTHQPENHATRKEIVKALDKKTLATLHKVVVEVADGSKAENEAATKKKIDADPEIGKKLAKAPQPEKFRYRYTMVSEYRCLPTVLEPFLPMVSTFLT
jgi:hypothetical protein